MPDYSDNAAVASIFAAHSYLCENFEVLSPSGQDSIRRDGNWVVCGGLYMSAGTVLRIMLADGKAASVEVSAEPEPPAAAQPTPPPAAAPIPAPSEPLPAFPQFAALSEPSESLPPVGEPLRPWESELDIVVADMRGLGYLRNLQVVADEAHPLGERMREWVETSPTLHNYRLVTFSISGSAQAHHVAGNATGGTFGSAQFGGRTYNGESLHCWGIVTVGDWTPPLYPQASGPAITGVLGDIHDMPVYLHILHDVLVAELVPSLPEVQEYKRRKNAERAAKHDELQRRLKNSHTAAGKKAEKPSTSPATAASVDISAEQMAQFQAFMAWRASQSANGKD